MKKRPLSTTVIGWLFIATGILGLAYHAREFNPQHPLENDVVVASIVRGLAILSGVFMLQGKDWARWLALSWMAFHVVISLHNSRSQLVMHAILLAVLGYFLFRPETREYFRAAP